MSTNKTPKQVYELVKAGKPTQALQLQEAFSFESFENVFYAVVKHKEIRSEQKEDYIRHFFKDYLRASKYFHQVCNSSRRREWFEILFVRRDLECTDLHKRIAIEEPLCFMETLRRNRVPFLRTGLFAGILEQDANKQLGDFLYTASNLSIRELIYFLSAVKHSEQLDHKPAEEVFSLVGLWLYYYVWDLAVKHDDPDISRIKEGHAVKAMNHFLAWFLWSNKYKGSKEVFDAETFQKEFIAGVDEKPPHYDIFLAWVRWNHFVISFVDEFCFEDKATVYIDKEKSIRRKTEPGVNEAFWYNDLKLHAYNKFEDEDYEEIGSGLDLDETQRLFLKLIGPVISRDNRNLLDEFIQNVHHRQNKLTAAACHGYALAFILPDKLLFDALTEDGFNEKKDWRHILLEIGSEKRSKAFHLLPFSLDNLDCKQRINQDFMQDPDKGLKEAELCFNSFIINIEEIEWDSQFNRFKEDFNLFDALRFKIGDLYYCFPRLNASQRLHTFMTKQVLKTHKDPKENQAVNDEMEQLISLLAKEKGFDACSKIPYKFSNRFGEQVNGEIDAVLYDGHILLGIEFKHSPLKASLEEISREREITLETASRQLDRFQKYVQTGDQRLNEKLCVSKKIKLEAMAFVGLIITTNFEFDHEMINHKYLKISWKEWLWAINDLKTGGSIQDLLHTLLQNTYWNEVIGI